ncbi:hypothetical protein CCACVL1_20025 [Corchorus capsularis]|uniref:Uncharacterized protein n=1 Tax=Corchorus capsularis TaxID=210143 RepID=A0A1R3HD10_COCAP|nr:hypothetical protein CCACVL1_20025 [Corchorus capsularis]
MAELEIQSGWGPIGEGLVSLWDWGRPPQSPVARLALNEEMDDR